jgi:hypothetical protein
MVREYDNRINGRVFLKPTGNSNGDFEKGVGIDLPIVKPESILDNKILMNNIKPA